MHAVGVFGQHARQVLGFVALGGTSQGDHAVVGGDVNVQAFGVAVPQQLGLDGRGGGRVAEAGRQRRVAFSALLALGVRVDLQLVVNALDAVDVLGNLFGQVAINVTLYITGQGGDAVFDIDINGEGVEVTVQGDGGPDRAFLAGFGQVTVVSVCGH